MHASLTTSTALVLAILLLTVRCRASPHVTAPHIISLVATQKAPSHQHDYQAKSLKPAVCDTLDLELELELVSKPETGTDMSTIRTLNRRSNTEWSDAGNLKSSSPKPHSFHKSTRPQHKGKIYVGREDWYSAYRRNRGPDAVIRKLVLESNRRKKAFITFPQPPARSTDDLEDNDDNDDHDDDDGYDDDKDEDDDNDEDDDDDNDDVDAFAPIVNPHGRGVQSKDTIIASNASSMASRGKNFYDRDRDGDSNNRDEGDDQLRESTQSVRKHKTVAYPVPVNIRPAGLIPKARSEGHRQRYSVAGLFLVCWMAALMSATEETHKTAQTVADTDDLERDIGDEEIEAMKQRVKEMEAEAAKLREMQAQAEKDMNMVEEDKEAVDARSVYVGNVDWGSTPEEIQAHFQSCGTINRITILCDKWTGQPKGYAYVEFADSSSVVNAMVLNESLFRARLIKVTPKRTNVPGMAARGRGRGRGAYRGGFAGHGAYGGYGHPPVYGAPAPYPGSGYRGRGRGRGRGGYYAPY
ncbi:cytoplasmic RNA-binding protein [Podila epigama]|nr:cytoplasmic RNA-binding protein [Podila epigama]